MRESGGAERGPQAGEEKAQGHYHYLQVSVGTFCDSWNIQRPEGRTRAKMDLHVSKSSSQSELFIEEPRCLGR